MSNPAEAAPSTAATIPVEVPLVEASIADLRDALEAGRITSVELVAASLNRIARYDRHGLALNAVPVLDPTALDQARASDERRAAGRLLGPLDGIPYTAKDSYQVRGLTVAAGSPAFEHLIAGDDAFAVERLRAGGAICLGLTNMPPMANGGMQRGVYGRAESPYRREYLAAAYLSGSSNGSGVATAAGYAAFGLGEETWSSGRSPASNNALVAYTPSRGLISIRGNWPLTPTMDVVVPHTRSVDDLFEVLDLLVVDDPDTRGDFWRAQPWVALPSPESVRPASFSQLRDADALRGRRFGVPRLYLGGDADAAWPVVPRASVLALWEAARRTLESLGAEVVEVGFPALERLEQDRPGALDGQARGILPARFFEAEMWDLTAWAWNDFLEMNADPALHRLADVDGAKIFPAPDGAIVDRVSGWFDRYNLDIAEYPAFAARGLTRPEEIDGLAEGVRGLEELRRIDLEDWLDDLGLDGLVFPSAVDVGRADADVDPASWTAAMANGVWVSTGNTMIRQYGVPTVNVPMGRMEDTGMPVNLTFAGRGYADLDLLRYGWAFEHATGLREEPPATPELPPLRRPAGAGSAVAELPSLELQAEVDESGESATVRVAGLSDAELVQVFVDGLAATVDRDGDAFRAVATIPASELHRMHSQWRGPYGAIVLALATSGRGNGTRATAQVRVVGGIA